LLELSSELAMRDMRPADLADVLVIERNAQISPWARVSFEESLAREHICRIAFESTRQIVIGFHVICVVADEMHILNIVVASAHQGQGIAHMLMNDILMKAQSNERVRNIFLEVRASNQIAQNLYRQWQFEQISIRKKYYQTANKEREDAVVMVKKLL